MDTTPGSVSVPGDDAARCRPPGFEVARDTPTWTLETVPAALLKAHRAATRAELVVEQGTVGFVESETDFVATARVDSPVTIVPGRDHHIEPSPDAKFFVRFYKRSDSESASSEGPAA